MTAHSDVDYCCTNCGSPYVPMSITPLCPNCGTVADRLFNDFIDKTLSSVKYNVRRYHSLSPDAWVTLSVGDVYFYFAFCFFNYAKKEAKLKVKDLLERKISSDKALKTAAGFMERVNTRNQPYMASAYQAYFSALICSGDNKDTKK